MTLSELRAIVNDSKLDPFLEVIFQTNARECEYRTVSEFEVGFFEDEQFTSLVNEPDYPMANAICFWPAPKYKEKSFSDYKWKETKLYACYLGDEFQRYVDDSIFIDGIMRSGFVQIPRFWRLNLQDDNTGQHRYSRDDCKEHFNLSAITRIKLMGLRFVKDETD